MTRELPCPECSGAGFFGDNGPVVESLCGCCRGTGVFYPAEETTPRIPVARSHTASFNDPAERDKWAKITSDMREYRDRQGYGS